MNDVSRILDAMGDGAPRAAEQLYNSWGKPDELTK
jgi:hypothetical protein